MNSLGFVFTFSSSYKSGLRFSSGLQSRHAHRQARDAIRKRAFSSQSVGKRVTKLDTTLAHLKQTLWKKLKRALCSSFPGAVTWRLSGTLAPSQGMWTSQPTFLPPQQELQLQSSTQVEACLSLQGAVLLLPPTGAAAATGGGASAFILSLQQQGSIQEQRLTNTWTQLQGPVCGTTAKYRIFITIH